MLTSTFALPFTLIASALIGSVSAHGPSSSDAALRHHRVARAAQAASSASGHHWSLRQLPGGKALSSRFERRSRRSSHRAVKLSNPSFLSEGSLTVEQGCTQFYLVLPNDSCYSAIAAAKTGLSLEGFYKINPQVNSDCYNLWTGYYYCVSTKAVSNSSIKTTHKTETKAKVTTPKVKVSTPKVGAPKAAASVNKSQDTNSSNETNDDEDCDADEVDKSSSSSSSGSSKPQNEQKPQTKPKPPPEPKPSTTTKSETPSAPKSNDNGKSTSSSDSGKSSSDGAQAQLHAQASSKPSSSSSGSSSGSDTSVSVSGGSSSSSSGGSDLSLLSKLDIKGFLGDGDDHWNGGAIASWFRTDSSQDSTNGNSWCFNQYDNSMPGFAADVSQMLDNFGGSNVLAGQAYCGLEAEFVGPNGESALLYLMDGFDSKWVKTPNSVDIIYDAFAKFRGSPTDNKNDVVTPVKWRWTGKKNPNYLFNGGHAAYGKPWTPITK